MDTAIHTLLASAWLGLLALYGYQHSMTAEGFALQGYIGTAIPVAAGALLYALGFIHGTTNARRA